MNEDLLSLLACPKCHGELSLDQVAARQGVRVIEGGLSCTGCGLRYRIQRGVPRFVATTDNTLEQRVADLFGAEFSRFSSGDADFDDRDVRRGIFFSRTGLERRPHQLREGDPYDIGRLAEIGRLADGSEISGNTVLDAGCGGGRFIGILAEHASRVVGLDLGPQVERVFETFGHDPKVDVVQGSVLEPPFKTASFDVVASVGVLHHTPAPQHGVIRLSRLVRPGGRLSIWVYPPEYWGGPLRAPFSRGVHLLLSRLPIDVALRICRRILLPLGLLQRALARHRWTKLLAAPLFVLPIPRHPRTAVMLATIVDYFCPPIITTHEPTEVVGWFTAAGFREVDVLPVRSAVSGRRSSG